MCFKLEVVKKLASTSILRVDLIDYHVSQRIGCQEQDQSPTAKYESEREMGERGESEERG